MGFFIVIIVFILDFIGDYYVCVIMCCVLFFFVYVVNCGIVVEGLCIMLFGVVGCGYGIMIYGGNIGVIGLIKVICSLSYDFECNFFINNWLI